jgi:hypothetical protein
MGTVERTMARWMTIGMVVLASSGCQRSLCEKGAALDQQLVLGVGELGFEPLQDGDEVRAVYGPQGGQHIWLSARAVGIDPGTSRPLLADLDVPVFRAELSTPDGKLVGSLDAPTWIAWEGNVSSAEMLGEELIVDTWSLGDGEFNPYDQVPAPEPMELWIAASMTDACGTQLFDEVRVLLAFD